MKEYVLTDARNLTVEEYIAFEERSEIRHEFINNQLIPKPGTTLIHNTICLNLSFLLRILLKRYKYRAGRCGGTFQFTCLTATIE